MQHWTPSRARPLYEVVLATGHAQVASSKALHRSESRDAGTLCTTVVCSHQT